MQHPPHLLTLTVNGKKEFISTSFDLAWHGRLFKDTHFIVSWELETNDPLKLTNMETHENPIACF